MPHKWLSSFSSGFIYISMIVVAIYNPSILGFIEDLGSPILVIILFLMPIYAIYKVPFMQKYKNQFIINIFLFVMGLITLLSVLVKLLN
jgi:serine transporter